MADTNNLHSTINTEVAHEASGLSAIGIDGGFLLAQVINFFLLFFILRALLYRPILKVLNERKKTIEDSLALAEETRLKAEAVSGDTKAMLVQARIEAKEIVEDAKSRSLEIASEIEQKAKLDAENLAQKTKALLLEERSAIVASAEKEMTVLLAKSLEKLFQDKRFEVSDVELERALSLAKEDK